MPHYVALRMLLKKKNECDEEYVRYLSPSLPLACASKENYESSDVKRPTDACKETYFLKRPIARDIQSKETYYLKRRI